VTSVNPAGARAKVMFSDEVHNVSLAADHDPMDYDLLRESSAKELAGYI
jgi:hypothetical protein